MKKDDIKSALDAADIEYDGRLSAENLAELLPDDVVVLEEPKDDKKEPARETVAAVVLRDMWPTEDKRIRKGSVIEVAPMELVEGMEKGHLKRFIG